MEFAIFLGLVLVVIVGFPILDRWHRRKAWRDASRSAERHLRLMRGEPPL